MYSLPVSSIMLPVENRFRKLDRYRPDQSNGQYDISGIWYEHPHGFHVACHLGFMAFFSGSHLDTGVHFSKKVTATTAFRSHDSCELCAFLGRSTVARYVKTPRRHASILLRCVSIRHDVSSSHEMPYLAHLDHLRACVIPFDTFSTPASLQPRL